MYLIDTNVLPEARRHAPPAVAWLRAARSDVDGLQDYHPYRAALAQMLADAGNGVEADAAYLRAIGLEQDPDVRRFPQQRRASLPPEGLTEMRPGC